MQASDILLRNLDDGGILRLTLNDPARRNALSEAMLAELGAAFADAGSNPSVQRRHPGRERAGLLRGS